MHIMKGKSYYKVREFDNLREMLRQSASLYSDNSAFKFKKDINAEPVTITYSEFARDVDYLGSTLCHLGHSNEKIAIIGANRYEWVVSFLSIVNGTGVVVPVDRMLPENEYVSLIARSKSKVVIYDPSFHNSFLAIHESLPDVQHYICMVNPENMGAINNSKFLSFPELIKSGKELVESGYRKFIDAKIDNNALCSLLYTSGTTSTSKGVMLSHRNISSDIRGISGVVKINPTDVALSILPLHHTFENTCGFLTMLSSGGCIAFCDGLRHINNNLIEYKVSVLVGVPLLFESMYKKILEQISKQGMQKKFNIGVKLGCIASVLFGNNARRKIMKSVLDRLGGRLRLIVSGAAAIDPAVSRGFENIGVRLVQGYGLTETSPVVAGCNDFILNHGSCGHPVTGAEIAIDNNEDGGAGEIMVRGPMVMLGYYENPEATAEVISPDGWFRTGDLGVMTKKGHIKITGRVKSMIVLKNGKKVFPEEVETLLNKLGFVKESMVWGEPDNTGEVDICARLVLDKDAVTDKFGADIDEPGLKRLLDQAIKSINHLMPSFKTVRYYMYGFEELTKTTTLKIKRYIEVEKIRNILKEASGNIRSVAGRNIDALLYKTPNRIGGNA